METPRSILPPDWTASLTAHAPTALGLDIGTTTKKLSNPSALVVTQQLGRRFAERLVLRWKTDDPDVTLQILDLVVEDIRATEARLIGGCIDASNETFYAKQARKFLLGRCPMQLIKGGEKITWEGEDYNYKTLLGLLYVQAFEDNLMATPGPKWLIADRRLVKREQGQFVTEVAEDGSHGDTFDAGKLALWRLRKGGPVQAAAAAVGQFLQRLTVPRHARHPFASKHQHRARPFKL